jgi:hypothetical protein
MNTALDAIVATAAILIVASAGIYQAVEISTLRAENEILRQEIVDQREMFSKYVRYRGSRTQKPN